MKLRFGGDGGFDAYLRAWGGEGWMGWLRGGKCWRVYCADKGLREEGGGGRGKFCGVNLFILRKESLKGKDKKGCLTDCKTFLRYRVLSSFLPWGWGEDSYIPRLRGMEMVVLYNVQYYLHMYVD